MPKYSIKIKNRWDEEIGVYECASLDEACHHLEKATYRRDLTIGKRRYEIGLDVPKDIMNKLREAGDIPPEPQAEPAVAPAHDEVSAQAPEVLTTDPVTESQESAEEDSDLAEPETLEEVKK